MSATFDGLECLYEALKVQQLCACTLICLNDRCQILTLDFHLFLITFLLLEECGQGREAHDSSRRGLGGPPADGYSPKGGECPARGAFGEHAPGGKDLVIILSGYNLSWSLSNESFTRISFYEKAQIWFLWQGASIDEVERLMEVLLNLSLIVSFFQMTNSDSYFSIFLCPCNRCALFSFLCCCLFPKNVQTFHAKVQKAILLSSKSNIKKSNLCDVLRTLWEERWRRRERRGWRRRGQEERRRLGPEG